MPSGECELQVWIPKDQQHQNCLVFLTYASHGIATSFFRVLVAEIGGAEAVPREHMTFRMIAIRSLQ
jgi:hypothetical protein